MLDRFRQLLHPIEGTAQPASDDATILLCEFRGVIREGSSGNSQVEQMHQVITRAMGGRVQVHSA